jgi:hypothetical protein
MNNFTTYELKSLLWAIDYVRERTNNCGDIMRALQGKLIEMIHESKDDCPHGVKHGNCFVCHQEGLTLEDKETLLNVPYEES